MTAADPSAYEAVVYDLDGTLVHLDVDWVAVERELAATLQDAGVDPSGLDTWAMLDAADAAGVTAAAEEVVARHEYDGAATSQLLPAAKDLASVAPVGICSLNAEAACRESLAVHGLEDHVHESAVIGRDTLGIRKPDPAPLLAAIESLGATPDTALFIGDSPSDEETARRAGTDFAAVDPPWDDEPDGPLRDER